MLTGNLHITCYGHFSLDFSGITARIFTLYFELILENNLESLVKCHISKKTEVRTVRIVKDA